MGGQIVGGGRDDGADGRLYAPISLVSEHSVKNTRKCCLSPSPFNGLGLGRQTVDHHSRRGVHTRTSLGSPATDSRVAAAAATGSPSPKARALAIRHLRMRKGWVVAWGEGTVRSRAGTASSAG